MKLIPHRRRSPAGAILLASAASLAALAVGNYVAGRWAERKHPPRGSFMEVDGVRLHYTDRGTGSPIVLIHGNAVSGDDFDTSGLVALLLQQHRVIAFDRPGFGYSDRPAGPPWTAERQAELLRKALGQLGVERPVVVGHSWGAIVALALALRHESDLAGLVLLSGYYFWTARPDIALASLPALPIVGGILRYTLSPLQGWLTMPLFKRLLFAPARVTPRFQAEFSPAMSLRPWQIQATAADAALMIPSVLALRDGYNGLTLPVAIIAGDGDKVVFDSHSERLHASIEGSVLQVVKGAGHMVHHVAARQVAEAVEAVAGRAG